MSKGVSPVEKFKKQFFEDLEKENNDEASYRLKRSSLTLYERNRSKDDPWSHCFYFDDGDQKESAAKYSFSLAAFKSMTNVQIADLISKGNGVTDEECNRCKFAFRRVIRIHKFPNLTDEPEKLLQLFLKVREKSYENIEELKKLSEEINEHLNKFKNSVSKSLEIFKPLCKLTVKKDMCFNGVKDNILKLTCMWEDFEAHADPALDSLYDAFEKFAKYQDIREEMDCNIFDFMAHFTSYYLIPRSVSARDNPI